MDMLDKKTLGRQPPDDREEFDKALDGGNIYALVLPLNKWVRCARNSVTVPKNNTGGWGFKVGLYCGGDRFLYDSEKPWNGTIMMRGLE